MGFFDDFSRFFQTSTTSPFPHRLNGRHTAIIARDAARLVGKRVLDIASHDGRWSFAALKAGAAHVTGIEPRQSLVDNARQTFEHYGIASDAYALHTGDAFEFLRKREFDVVLCLGYFYHTIRHAELLDLIERTGAGFVVIDTEITAPQDALPDVDSADPRLVFGNPYSIQLVRDQVEDQQMAFPDALTRNGYTLAGRTSRAAIRYMADHFGFRTDEFDWPAHFREHPEQRLAMVDYDEGWRSTFYLDRA
jgi:predicted nicotinamide N-methyase